MPATLPRMTEAEARELAALAALRVKYRREQEQSAPPKPVWTPFPGSPQEAARDSEADILGFGGQAGGGKSDLLLGLAGTEHQRSIIFRRVFPSLRALIERSREIFNADSAGHAKDSYNESLHVWRLTDGRIIEFGAMQLERDTEKHRGQPRDFYGIDEGPEFTELQVRTVIGWNRSTTPGQRCRVVITFNPPNTEEGMWIIRFFAPWLDPTHPNPARPGELRWFAQVDGQEIEVASGAPFEHKGEIIQPRSRTFIPAALKDNPILEASGYRAVLQSLPEPLRSQLLYGDMSIGVEANPYQAIPTEWIRAAMKRWDNDPRSLPASEPDHEELGPLDAVGVDVARGGKDKTVFSARYGTWFAPLVKHAGRTTPDGPAVATLLTPLMVQANLVNIDAIGVGASAYDQVRAVIADKAQAIVFSEGAKDEHNQPYLDKSNTLRFTNKRAWAYWRLREALDPTTGDNLSLPNDPELLADLAAPRWKQTPGGVQLESKEDLSKRIGRSPDAGDAVVLALLPAPVIEEWTSA